jgi:23S rRNA (adenine2503-C2)-methyltransferase
MLSGRPDLRNHTLEEMERLMAEWGLPRFRAEQLFRGVHGRAADSLHDLTDLSKKLREELSERAVIGRLEIAREQISHDGTRKLALRTFDGRLIETVLIPDGDASADDDDADLAGGDSSSAPRTRGGFRGPRTPPEHLAQVLFPRHPKLTQCISSQVGCALDCAFCATAKLGFGRQLSAGEIVDQVYRAERIMGSTTPDDPTRRAGAERVTNVVFMGMGEPLHNFDNLVRALRILTHPFGPGFARRRITVSTAGLVPGIERLAQEPLQVHLALSLNATTDEVRDQIMPINQKWKISRLLEAVRKMPLKKRQRITFEYVLLGGVNDSDQDAARLPRLLHGIPAKINLIPWNPHSQAPYRRPSDERVSAFHEALRREGLAVYVRRSRGDDIDAACGQLAARGDTPLLSIRRDRILAPAANRGVD